MSVCSTIFNALLGPLIIYLMLMGHVAYQMFIVEPEPLSIQSFPTGTSKAAKDSLISGRRELIKDMMDALAGKARKDLIKKWCTDDIEFEDFLMKWSGQDEFQALLDSAAVMVHSIDYDIHSENHSPHEIVMDWTLKCTLNGLTGYPISLNMRTHFLLEPPTKVGGSEKLFRIYEEWNGNKQLNEKTTFPLLGRVHSKLRRFTGWMAAKSVNFDVKKMLS